MSLRSLTGLAAVSALLLAGATAQAAPKICMQIVDDAGDGTGVAGTPSHDTLDILSADIATGKKNLVVAVRFKSLAADPTLPLGTGRGFRFVAAGIQHDLGFATYAGGETEATMWTGGDSLNAITVGGVADTSTSTVTWTVPRKLVPGLKKTGTKISSLSASSTNGNNVKIGGGGTHGGSGADSASTGRTYTDGAPTCLRGV